MAKKAAKKRKKRVPPAAKQPTLDQLFETALSPVESAPAIGDASLHDLFQQLDDRNGQAGTWDSLGYIHHHREDYGQAISCYRRAIDLFREIGNRFGEADTLTHLGESYLAAGDIATARAAWHHSLQIFTELEHPNAADIQTKIINLDVELRTTEPG